MTRRAIHLLQQWCEAAPADVHTGVSAVPFDDLDTVADEVIHETLALNLLWTDGRNLGGARLNRSLWSLRRTASYTCPICGEDHTDATENDPYRATVLASEHITDEDWAEVPNGSVFHVGNDGVLDTYCCVRRQCLSRMISKLRFVIPDLASPACLLRNLFEKSSQYE